MLEYARFHCPSCGSRFRVAGELAGVFVRCERCDKLVLVPGDPVAPGREVVFHPGLAPPQPEPKPAGPTRRKAAPAADDGVPVGGRRRSGGFAFAPILLLIGTASAIGVVALAVYKARSAEVARVRLDAEVAELRAELDRERAARKPAPPTPGRVNRPPVPPRTPVDQPAPAAGMSGRGGDGAGPADPAGPRSWRPEGAAKIGDGRNADDRERTSQLTARQPVFTYPTPAPRPVKEATPGYYLRTAHGFQLCVSREAHERSDRLNGQPIGCLESEPQTIVERLPAAHVKRLRKFPIWVEWDHVVPGNRDVLAVYHGRAGEALLLTGVDPRKAGCVTVMTLENVYLLKSRDRYQGTVLLHELAHAVHDQVFGFDNPYITNAYKQAVTKGLYKGVEHAGGGRHDGYAVTNEAEYFAELSCGYLDRLNYHPFDAAGLREYDSVGYEIMTKAWGTEEAIAKAIAADQARREKLRAAKR